MVVEETIHTKVFFRMSEKILNVYGSLTYGISGLDPVTLGDMSLFFLL